MTKNTGTMTDLLRAALLAAPSLNEVGRATGTKRQSLSLFMAGKQSLRLDKADALAAYFGIACIGPASKPRAKPRAKKREA